VVGKKEMGGLNIPERKFVRGGKKRSSGGGMERRLARSYWESHDTTLRRWLARGSGKTQNVGGDAPNRANRRHEVAGRKISVFSKSQKKEKSNTLKDSGGQDRRGQKGKRVGKRPVN